MVEVEAEDGGHDWRTRAQRDPIVKLVVACCFSRFHITAIFDDLDRRFFATNPCLLYLYGDANRSVHSLSGYQKLGPKSEFLRGNLCSKNGKMARVHRSQSGCDMLIQAFISQPALMSVASR